MPPTIWLPVNKAPKHATRDERTELMWRLRATGYSVMGTPVEMQDIPFLRDVVQRCEEKKAADDLKQAKRLIDYPEVPRYSPGQIRDALKELLAFQKQRAAGRKAFY